MPSSVRHTPHNYLLCFLASPNRTTASNSALSVSVTEFSAVWAYIPYITRTIKRFGDYVVNLDVVPTPLAGAMELPLDDIQGAGETERPA